MFSKDNEFSDMLTLTYKHINHEFMIIITDKQKKNYSDLKKKRNSK